MGVGFLARGQKKNERFIKKINLRFYRQVHWPKGLLRTGGIGLMWRQTAGGRLSIEGERETDPKSVRAMQKQPPILGKRAREKHPGGGGVCLRTTRVDPSNK